MMFRKKPDIPPRPKLPTVEQIVDDIEHSFPEDVAFKNSGNCQQDSVTDLNSPEAIYQKVQTFVGINTTLKEELHKLREQGEALKISDLELKAMADDIRKQALEALQ